MNANLRGWAQIALEAVGWLLLSALAVILSTWPTASQRSGHLLEPLHLPDVQGGMYWPWACARALAAGDPIYQRSELLWPYGQDVTLILWNHGVQLVIFPFFLFTDPVTATNLGALWIATLNGAAGAWAGWAASGRRAGALAGLAVAACSPYGFLEAGVGRPEQGLWAPMALFIGGFVRIWERPRDPIGILLCGLGVALSGAVYWFYAIFLVVLMAITLPIAALTRSMDGARLLGLVAAGMVSVVAVLPFLVPVLSALGDAPTVVDDAIAVNEPLLVMQSRAPILFPWGFGGAFGSGLERSWRAPILLIPLCLLGLIRGRGGVRLASAMGLLAALFAAGPVWIGREYQTLTVGGYALQLPHALLNLLPGFERFWWPYRWQAGAIAASCVAGGWLVSRLSGRRAWWAAALLLVWSVGESAGMLRDAGVRPVLGPVVVPPVFTAIGDLQGGPRPILQMPSAWLRNSRVGWIAWHHQPIDGGMGWGMMRDRAEAHADSLSTLPLMRAIRRAQVDADYVPPARWLPEEAGGYHYVVFYNEGPSSERGPVRRGLKRVLGEPFYSDASMLFWAIPGMGEIPPESPQP
ncbi:MAG: hypothetical protein AAFV53_03320 [Myxococcota bacterium]